MKVPKMYKSSDLYDAGTDVIYDDDSKLQYAPFVYATDSGDSGDDEEGEETMVVTYDGEKLDKSYKEITDALSSGKFVYVHQLDEYTGGVAHVLLYIDTAYKEDEGDYTVVCEDFNSQTTSFTFTSQTEDGVLNKQT